MKKNLYKLSQLLFVALILLSSCRKDQLTTNGTSLTTAQKVAKLGFDTTGMKITNGLIVVEGDIVLKESELNKTSARQASSVDLSNGAYPISYSKHRYLKYYVDPSVSNWETAFDNAFYIYSTYENFDLRFQKLTSASGADIVIKDSTFTNHFLLAEARFPDNGNLGNFIGVNNADYSGETSLRKLFTAVHEIGHTIGFRHTNWRGRPENEFDTSYGVSYGAYTIPGTPNSADNPDPSSVFYSTVSDWAGFSSYDNIALKTMYPTMGPAVLTTSPSAGPVAANTVITASVAMNPYWREGGLIYTWTVQGGYITSGSNTPTITMTVTDPSSAGVFCMITNAHSEGTAVSRSFGDIAID